MGLTFSFRNDNMIASSKRLPLYLRPMTSLKPVDFKAVAAKGAYVYCYLREDGSPYYVGIASQGQSKRPFQKHSYNAHTPTDQARVRLMRSGLTFDEAKNWEIFYIARFGRKDLETGILRNQTDGGEGNLNPSEETRFAIGSARRGVAVSDSTKALISNASSQQSNKSTAAMIAANAARMATIQGRSELSQKLKVYCSNPVVKKQRSEQMQQRWANKETAVKIGAAIKAAKVEAAAQQAFKTYGISPEVWKQLTKPQKNYAPKWLPIAEFMGLTLLEYAGLTRPEKLRAAAAFRAA